MNVMLETQSIASFTLAVTVSNVAAAAVCVMLYTQHYNIIRHVLENIVDFSRTAVFAFQLLGLGRKMDTKEQILLFYMVFACFDKQGYLHAAHLALARRLGQVLCTPEYEHTRLCVQRRVGFLEVVVAIALLFVVPRRFQYYYSSIVLFRAMLQRSRHSEILFAVQLFKLFSFEEEIELSYLTLICCCCVYLQFEQIFEGFGEGALCPEPSREQLIENMATKLFFSDITECKRICSEFDAQRLKIAYQNKITRKFADVWKAHCVCEAQYAAGGAGPCRFAVTRHQILYLRALYSNNLFLFNYPDNQQEIRNSYQLISHLEQKLGVRFTNANTCPYFHCHISSNMIVCLMYILSFADYADASLQLEITNPFVFQKQQIQLSKAQRSQNSQLFITKIGNTHAILSNIQQRHYVFIQIDGSRLKPGVLQIYNDYILNENYQIEKLKLEIQNQQRYQSLQEVKLVLDVLRCYGISLLENQWYVSLFIPQRHRHIDHMVHPFHIKNRCAMPENRVLADEYIARHSASSASSQAELYDDHVQIGSRNIDINSFDFWGIQKALARH